MHTESDTPTRLAATFDDDRAMAGAGLALVATLWKKLDTYTLANQLIDLGGLPGHAVPGRMVLTLVHAMVAGADCIDDCDVLRSGATSKVLGHEVMAPSTLGPFLRIFSFGHVRQLDALSEALLARACDLLGEMVRMAAELLMDADVDVLSGAGYGERSEARVNSRNGHREPRWDTRVGTITLDVPKLRKGRYLPSLLEPRQRAEQAPVSVVLPGLRRGDLHPAGGRSRQVDGHRRHVQVPGLRAGEVP